MQWYTWCVIVFALLAVVLQYRMREEKPVSEDEVERLKQQASQLVYASERLDFEQAMDISFIEKQTKLTYLRAYTKFAGLCDIPSLDVLLSGVIYRYVFFKSSLSPKKLTNQHVEIFVWFNNLDNHLWDVTGDEESQKRYKQFQRTVFYAIEHPGQTAEKVFAIVRDRGVVDLKSVKKLMKDFDEAPSSALSEGML